MRYNEPKDWLLPARHCLGNVLLSTKQYAKAKAVFREDLKINPNNVWSPVGYQNALVKQKKVPASRFSDQQIRKALLRSDGKINSPVF